MNNYAAGSIHFHIHGSDEKEMEKHMLMAQKMIAASAVNGAPKDGRAYSINGRDDEEEDFFAQRKRVFVDKLIESGCQADKVESLIN